MYVWAQPYDETVCTEGEGHFEVTATGTKRKYQWQMSDDNQVWTDVQNNHIFSGADSTYLYLKNIPDTFDKNRFRCIVSNNLNSDTSYAAALDIISTLPIAEFDYYNNRDSFFFTGQAQNAEYNWWSFTTTNDSFLINNPRYFFEEVGTYEVLHLAKNACGIDTVREVIEITPLKADFTADKTSGCAPLTVNFTSIVPFRTLSTVWEMEGATPSRCTYRACTATYDTPGTYDVRLIAYNNGTPYELDTLILKDYITVYEGNGNELSPFSILETGTPDSLILAPSHTEGTAYNWFVNGRNVSQDTTLLIPPLNPGVFEIILEISNACGMVADTFQYITGLEAKFSAADSVGCIGDPVQFFNHSPNFVDSIKWYFRGGGPPFSTIDNPIVKYARPGNYSVQLTVFQKMNRTF